MKNVLPPTYFLSAVVLMVSLHFLLPLKTFIAFPWRLVGLVPLLIGIVLNLAADRAFKNNDTTVKPFEEPKVLITEGVFNISRNPMYLGMISILFGVAIFLGSAAPFTVIPVFIVLLDRIFISPEEHMLEETFGNTFRQYRNRVRKWI